MLFDVVIHPLTKRAERLCCQLVCAVADTKSVYAFRIPIDLNLCSHLPGSLSRPFGLLAMPEYGKAGQGALLGLPGALPLKFTLNR